MSQIPACCVPTENAETAEIAYAAYNAAGDPTTAGLNYAGQPCPVWAALTPNIQEKWRAAVAAADRNAMTFGAAIDVLKAGGRVCRAGWNGKGMWLILIRAGNAMHTSRFGGFDMQDCIGMKTAGGVMQPGWLASQADMLANDWMEVG